MIQLKNNERSYKLWTLVLILSLFLAILNPFFVVKVHAMEQIPNIPTVNAKSIFVMDARTGTELYAKQPDEYMSTETLLPMLISLVVLDAKNPADNILISNAAQQMSTQINGKSGEVGLKDGERMAISQLLCALLMAQSQDATVALSGIFESDAEFLRKIQDKVTELELSKTVISSYLSGSNLTDHTTTRDLSRVMQEFLKNPELLKINAQAKQSFTPNNMVPEPRIILNKNLQFQNDSEFYLQDLIAGQYFPGSTELPQNNSYVGTTKNNQGMFIVALAGSLESEESYTNSKKLFDWAFKHFKAVLLIQQDEIISSLPLANGESLELRADKDVYHLINASMVKPDFSLNLNPGEQVEDTIAKDQPMGNAEIVVQDKIIGTVNLLANQSANLSDVSSLKIKESTFDKALRWTLQIGLGIFFIGLLILIIRTINLMRRSRNRQAQLRAKHSEIQQKMKHQVEDEENQQIINRSNF